MRHLDFTEPTLLNALSDELAQTYDVPALMSALTRRLEMNGFTMMARFITRSYDAGEVPRTRAVYFAIALIGRLRISGRGHVADAVLSALSSASAHVDPVLWLNDARALVALRRGLAAHYRAHGLDEQANECEATMWTCYKNTLEIRLEADGHVELARAISDALRSEPTVVVASAPAPPAEPTAEMLARWEERDKLAASHPADVWAHAAIMKLRAERREVLAGSIMTWWAREIAGPMVDPAELVTELLAELRSHGRESLADKVVTVLGDAPIRRDPCEIMTRWLKELSRPMMDAAPLGAALIAGLRNEGQPALAGRVSELLESA